MRSVEAAKLPIPGEQESARADAGSEESASASKNAGCCHTGSSTEWQTGRRCWEVSVAGSAAADDTGSAHAGMPVALAAASRMELLLAALMASLCASLSEATRIKSFGSGGTPADCAFAMRMDAPRSSAFPTKEVADDSRSDFPLDSGAAGYSMNLKGGEDVFTPIFFSKLNPCCVCVT